MKLNSLAKAAGLFMVVLLFSCSEESPEEPADYDIPAAYLLSARSFVVQVSYEPTAEPYTGSTGGISGVQCWTILARNLRLLLACRSRIDTVVVPSALADMYSLPDLETRAWTPASILSLAQSYRPRLSTADSAFVWVAFVGGCFQRDTGIDSSVIGVTLSGTGVIAVFKDVVRRIGHTDVVRRFVEQSTLVHELGHTIGLVDLGVPLTSTHEDPAHEHHCIFENCIMYWANEGAADLAQFVQRYAMTGDAVLFGQECLADVCEFGE